MRCVGTEWCVCGKETVRLVGFGEEGLCGRGRFMGVEERG